MQGALQHQTGHATVDSPTWSYRPARSHPRLYPVKRLCFALTLLIPLMASAEIALRYAYFPAPPRSYRPESGTNGGYHALLQHADRINENGTWVRAYRGRTVTRTKTNMFRILCLGGSTTWGHHLKAEQTWPRMLEAQLTDSGYDVEVINAGRPWYTTVHSITNYATQMRYYNPDVVIIMHGVNDLTRSFPAANEPPAEWDYGSYQGPMKNILSGYRANNRVATIADWNPIALMRSSAIFRLAFDRTDQAKSSPEQALGRNDFTTLEPLCAHLDYLTRLCSNDHTAVVLATQAHIYERDDMATLPVFEATVRQTYMKTRSGAVADAPSIRAAMRIVRDTVLDVAKSHAIPIADVQQAVGNEAKYFLDDFHVNPAGNVLTANAMVDVLRPLLDEMATPARHVYARPLPGAARLVRSSGN